MKKIVSLLMAAVISTGLFAGCGAKTNDSITVVSREDGSGTRSAFVELLGIVDADGGDAIVDTAEVSNSTSVVITTVKGNKNAIGYASLGSVTGDVKALKINGVAATVDNIKNGSYPVARPFNVAYKNGALSELDEDFLSFILSADGQAIINDKGYISVSEGEPYAPAGLSGKITLAGSTSVAPVMDVLADRYKELNPGVTIEIQQSGSSAGITSAIEGVCAFGMSSRGLKADEAAALECVTIAMDGIAVIVNNENGVSDIKSEQIKNIYLGSIKNWSEIG